MSLISFRSNRDPDGSDPRCVHSKEPGIAFKKDSEMHSPALYSKSRSSTIPNEDDAWIRRLWPGVKFSDINQEHYNEYLRFANEKIKIFNSVCPQPSPFENFFDILRLILLFQQEANLTRQRAAEIEGSILPPDGCDASVYTGDVVWRCVELAICLWATLDIRVPGGTSCSPTSGTATALFPGQMSYLWVDDRPLQTFIVENFGNRGQKKLRLTVSSEISTLEPKCTIAYLYQAHDFRPHWTSNLADHLKIDTNSRTVTVYEHKVLLWNHLESTRHWDERNSSPVLPRSVLSEAIDTLNLLFPFGDGATEALLKRAGKEASLYNLGNCSRGRQLEMSRYEHWRDDLEEIAAVVSQPPRGRAQFLLDRERTNPRDVWTFWTAMAFGTLAVIGVATGMYSAVYARKAFDVGLLQYQLALAQACSVENSTEFLSDYCS